MLLASPGLAIYSEAGKWIDTAIEQVFGYAEHRECMRLTAKQWPFEAKKIGTVKFSKNIGYHLCIAPLHVYAILFRDLLV